VFGVGLERVAQVVRREDGNAAGTGVNVRRLHRLPQLVLTGEIHDGVMDEDRVEGAAQPERTHVAQDMPALRVEDAADVEHRRRDVRERRLDVSLVVGGHVAGAGAQLQHRSGRFAQRTGERVEVEGRFLLVLVRCGEDEVPGREGGVDLRQRGVHAASGSFAGGMVAAQPPACR
jgi:hypothetical protein